MATYKKRTALNKLNATMSLNYGAKGVVKSLNREYNEVYDVKKTLKDAMIQLIAFNTDAAFLAGTLKDCKYILICNEGDASAELEFKIAEWTTTAGSHAVSGSGGEILHTILHPNDYIMLPNIRMIHSGTGVGSGFNGDDDALANATPSANLYEDTGVNLDGDLEDTETAMQVADIAPFEVGDLVQVGINASTTTRMEIMEVTAITDDSGTDADANGTLVVTRALFGTLLADKDSQNNGTNGVVSGANVYFPFFNEYYDHDRALQGSSQLVSTDNLGRWKSRNFFGKGRSAEANDAEQGIVAGSVAIKFFEKSFQEIAFGGSTSNIMITSSTNTKLTAGDAYAFDLTIDDSSATTVSFTIDSSNTNFGGTNGVISKIQTAVNTLTQTTGGGLYGYSCTVSIEGGRLRFTSNSHLAPHDGTNGSKVLLADASSGTNVFSGSAGIFPDDAVINAPVAAKLPDDEIIDTITGTTYSNTEAFLRDDGYGNLIYGNSVVGSVVYQTGAIEWTISSLPNAQFVITAHYSAAFSGGLSITGTQFDNGIKDIYGASINPKINALIGVYAFN